MAQEACAIYIKLVIVWIDMNTNALFALLLLLSAVPVFAEETSMKTFCTNLLSLDKPLDNETNVTYVEENQTFNFTYSKQHDEALVQLGQANVSIARMKDAGFPYIRSQDIYLTAMQWFEGQSALELADGTPDYRFVIEKVAEIKTIERESFSVNDDLRALAMRIQNATIEVNRSEVLNMQAQARQEFLDSRFEEARRIVNNAYDKISELEAETTRSKTLAESARRNIETFLQENWQKIVAVFAVIIVIFLVFQKQIRRFLIEVKIHTLTMEKAVLDSMLKNLQKDYFESGKVNELSYHIKTKKFGDIVRNINRQIPLLKEELKKI